jgi:hypothetical protein
MDPGLQELHRKMLGTVRWVQVKGQSGQVLQRKEWLGPSVSFYFGITTRVSHAEFLDDRERVVLVAPGPFRLDPSDTLVIRA